MKLVESKSINKVSSKEQISTVKIKLNTSKNNLRNNSSVGNKIEPKKIIDKFFVTFNNRQDNVNLDSKNNQKIHGKLI